jgi:hypothetical protein
MIYTTFKQWVKGRFLEIGEPRKQAYSKEELALIEMGWGYGYDAGVQWQKSQTALDKKAENARELGLDYEPAKNETVTAEQHDRNLHAKYKQDMQSRNWISFNDWLLEATPPQRTDYERGVIDGMQKQAQSSVDKAVNAMTQRTWVGLTDAEVEGYWDWEDFQTGAGRLTIFEMVRDIEAKLKEKNNA